MKIGDTVVYEKLTKVDDERLLAHIPTRAQITAKYPFLVSVVCEGDRPCPIRTMTYWEILAGNLWRPQK